MLKFKSLAVISIAPVLLIAGAAHAAATRSADAGLTDEVRRPACLAQRTAEGRAALTAPQQVVFDELAKREVRRRLCDGLRAADAGGHGFLGGGIAPAAIGGLVAAGLGVGIASGSNNSPGG